MTDSLDLDRGSVIVTPQQAFAATIVETAPDAIVVLDSVGVIVGWNDCAERLFGWRADEIVGRLFTVLLPETRRAEYAERHRQSNRWRRDHRRTLADVEVLRRDGSPFLAEIDYATFTSDGRRCVTAVVREQRAVLTRGGDTTRIFLETMIECSPDAIICTDGDGMIIAWNTAAEKLYGYAAREVVGRSIMITIPDERRDEAHRVLQRVHAGERVSGWRTVRRRKDGTLFDVEPTWWPVYDRAGALLGVAIVIHDVSERVELEEQLDDVTRIAAIGRLAATVAHEFNNVLMAIQPFVDVIQRRARADPSVASAVRHITNALMRGRNITEEVLRFGKPATPNYEELDATEWLRRLGEELRMVVPGRIDLHVTFPDAPVRIRADAHQLTQLLMNLVLNARDAIGRRSGEIDVALSAQRELGVVRIVVEDSGPGIPAAVAAKVFEPLFTTKASGTGLGLPVARQIAERHGGDIKLSATQQGTRFEVTLPILIDGGTMIEAAH